MRLTSNASALLGVMFSALVLTNLAHAGSSRITSDKFVQYGHEDAYWVSNLVCTDGLSQAVQRKTDSAHWCVKGASGFCNTSKQKTADMACGESVNFVLASKKVERERAIREEDLGEKKLKSKQHRVSDRKITGKEVKAGALPNTNRSEQTKNEIKRYARSEKQISIEAYLIKIAQEKLNLRRQELSLQKRERLLKTILGNETS